MSRSGYSDDHDQWALIKYRGQVASAIRGKRGQKMLRDLRDALEAMPQRRLIAGELEADGEVCALGALGRARGIDMSKLDAHDRDEVGAALDIAQQLAGEAVYLNDEANYGTPEERWEYMHRWVLRQILGGGA